jgi:hypothetical protein
MGSYEWGEGRQLDVALEAGPRIRTVGYFEQVFVQRSFTEAVKGGRKPPQSSRRRRRRRFRA